MGGVSKFQVRPLYLQVRDAILERIKDGRWKPGASLPSEIDLYRELGVSLGTLRKALGVLDMEKIIIREPGRGTFVRDHQQGGDGSRFNPIRSSGGDTVRGEIKTKEVKLCTPTGVERSSLNLDEGDQVVRIHRIRMLGQRPFAFELLCLPNRRFPGLSERADVPDEIEELAQTWGVLVARAKAKIRVMPAPHPAAAALSIADNTAVLFLERLTFDTDAQPIEVMTGYFDLRDEYCQLEMN